MSAAYWSGQLVHHLTRALKAHDQRLKALNRLAEGEATQTPDQRESLIHSEKMIVRLLAQLETGITRRMRVVTVDEMTASREQLPTPIRDAYELLFIQAYGSDPAISSGDPVVKPGIGKPQVRVSTNRDQGIGGAASGGGKRPGASTRNIIKDRRAYEMKIKVDRRLRRLSKEIFDFLAGAETMREVNVCSRCARIGEDDWRFCPSCGFEMRSEVRE